LHVPVLLLVLHELREAAFPFRAVTDSVAVGKSEAAKRKLRENNGTG